MGWKQVGFKVLLPLRNARAICFSWVRSGEEKWSVFCGMDVASSNARCEQRDEGGEIQVGLRRSMQRCSTFTMVPQGPQLHDIPTLDCHGLGVQGAPSSPVAGKGSGDARRTRLSSSAGGKGCPAVSVFLCSLAAVVGCQGCTPAHTGRAWGSAPQTPYGRGPFTRSEGSLGERGRGRAGHSLGQESPADVFLGFFFPALLHIIFGSSLITCVSVPVWEVCFLVPASDCLCAWHVAELSCGFQLRIHAFNEGFLFCLVQGRICRKAGKSKKSFSRKEAEATFKSLVKTHEKYGWVTPPVSDG